MIFNSYRCAGAANPRPSPFADPHGPFACQNEYWQMADDGSDLRRLTGGTTPETARDAVPQVSLRNGRELVLKATPTSRGGERIFSQYPGGSDRRQLTPNPPDARLVGDNWPVQSPVENLIAFDSQNRQGNGDGDDSFSDVWLMRFDGSGLRPFTSGPGMATRPAFTADGSRLIYGREFAHRSTDFLLVSRGLDGGPELPVGPAGLLFNASFSPDGRYMAYESPGSNHTLSLFALDLATGAVTPVATSVIGHSWSPLGPTLFFSAPVGEGKHGIYRRRLGALDRGAQQLTDGGPEPGSTDANPSWIAIGLSLPEVEIPDDLPPAVGVLASEVPPSGAAASARRRERALTVVDPSGVRRVRVALARRVRGGCRAVRRTGRLGHRRGCRRLRMRAVRPDGLARLTRGLPAGRYVARLRLRDGSGNTARRVRRFRIRR